MRQKRSTASRSYDGVLAVVRERRRHRHAERRLADRDVDPEPRERRVQLLVELGDGEPVDELERLDLAAARRDHEAVVDEVEVDLERDAVAARAGGASSARARRRRAARATSGCAARVDAMPHLADDLRPEMQRVLRRLPARSSGSSGTRPPNARRRHVTPFMSHVRLDDEGDLVDVAPAPVLARLGRAGDRMAGPPRRAGLRAGSATSRSSRSSRSSCTSADAASGSPIFRHSSQPAIALWQAR